ncbi:MAG TPA: GNAT family N-acetyltransferase [Acidobacteriaceae bacterium]|jgi:RimJ/RimL family protein N-acetyltransferase|nr:GNAT family N-acetyltransferase [Acidobacteriaceae bacterium]
MRWWESEEPPLRVTTVEGPFPQGGRQMKSLLLRRVQLHDIGALAALRAQEWQTTEYWEKRIRAYLDGTLNPQQALPERVLFVAEEQGAILAFIAGHRTRRHGCEGELEWINVDAAHRGRGLSRPLLQRMAAWFVEQRAFRVCVNVRADNEPAVALYTRAGAQPLQDGWMVWPDIRTLTNPKP